MARKQGVIFSYIYMAFEVLSGVLFTPFLIKSLGQAEYGVYSLVASMTAYLLLLDFGVGNAVVRYMSKFRISNDMDQMRKFLGVTVLFYCAVASIVVILGLVMQNYIAVFFDRGLDAVELQKAKEMFSITMLNVAVTLLNEAFVATLMAFEKFAFSKMLGILKVIFRMGISMLFLSLGFGGVSVVAVNFGITVVFGIVYILYVIFKLRIVPYFRRLDFGFIREIVGYSFFIFLQMVALQITNVTDQILIGALVASSSGILAIYAAGAQIPIYFRSIAGSVNNVLMPGVVRMVEKGAEPKQLLKEMVRIGRMLFIILGLIYMVFLVNGRVFMKLWAGNPNIDGYWVAVIIMLPMVFYLAQLIGSQILWAMGKHKIQAVLQICVAVANILLTIVLIRWNPLIGAAIGTAVAVFVGNVVVMNIVFNKYIHISMKEYYQGLFRGILPCLIICGVCGFLISLLPLPEVLGFLINCGSMVAVFGILLFAFGANQYEKDLVLSIFKKLVRGRR